MNNAKNTCLIRFVVMMMILCFTCQKLLLKIFGNHCPLNHISGWIRCTKQNSAVAQIEQQRCWDWTPPSVTLNSAVSRIKQLRTRWKRHLWCIRLRPNPSFIALRFFKESDAPIKCKDLLNKTWAFLYHRESSSGATKVSSLARWHCLIYNGQSVQPKRRLHLAMKRWFDNRVAISPIFKFSSDVRTVIYTTNAIEILNSTYRRLNNRAEGILDRYAWFRNN